jgi:hypothetical protein
MTILHDSFYVKYTTPRIIRNPAVIHLYLYAAKKGASGSKKKKERVAPCYGGGIRGTGPAFCGESGPGTIR